MKEQPHYEIPKEKLEKGIKLCIDRAKQLTKDAVTVAKKGNISHSLGLYTFAVEEFGKSLLLKEQKEMKNGNVLVPVWIFGGKSKKRKNSHNKKFQKALKELPYPCNVITLWEEIVDIASPEDRIIDVKGLDEPAVISAGLTGEFGLATDPDFEERLRVFYVDWNDEKKDWVVPHYPPKEQFLESMKNFQSYLENPEKFKSQSKLSCER